MDDLQLKDLREIKSTCDSVLEEAGKGLSTLHIEQRCRELDAGRRIWAGFIYEERQRQLGVYLTHTSMHDLAGAMAGIRL